MATHNYDLVIFELLDGDINEDCEVDVTDFALLAGNISLFKE